LFDTAGQEDYDRLRPLCYPQTDVVVISFAITSPSSLYSVQRKWHPEVNHFVSDVPIVLVGLKGDLRRDKCEIQRLKEQSQTPVSFKDGLDVAKRIGAEAYVECSALTGEGIKEAFEAVSTLALVGQVSGPEHLADSKDQKCIVM